MLEGLLFLLDGLLDLEFLLGLLDLLLSESLLSSSASFLLGLFLGLDLTDVQELLLDLDLDLEPLLELLLELPLELLLRCLGLPLGLRWPLPFLDLFLLEAPAFLAWPLCLFFGCWRAFSSNLVWSLSCCWRLWISRGR